MEIIPLPSGRKLGLAIAPFSASNKLRKVIAAELLSIKMEIDPSKLDFNMDISKMDARALNTMKDVVCKLLSSDVVENAFFECAAKCTIDGVKITRGSDRDPGSFEEVEARGDLIPVAWEVMRANVGPFFTSLGSLLSTGKKATTEDQPSE